MPPSRDTRARPRRPGPRRDGDARGRIRAAAAELFSTRGYAATTMRAVAAAADVDVALIAYYFGNKAGLFAAVVQLPADQVQVIRQVLQAGMDGAGERITRTFLAFWDAPESGAAMTSFLRNAAADEHAGRTFGQVISTSLLRYYRKAIGGPDAERRSRLAVQQLIGLAMARYILRVEPLASAPAEQVVAEVAPLLQHILTGSRDQA